MSLPTSPSPPPRTAKPSQSQLPPSSIFLTPSFSSTLPLPRPISASGAFRRTSLSKKGRLASSQHRKRTRSVASSISQSSDGSLGDFSMENYTIDLAQLGRRNGGARPLGFEKGFQISRKESEEAPKQEDAGSGIRDEQGDFMGGYTIDLGGLGDKPSSVVVEDTIHHVEHVQSDDEGPEDFTQNLEAWMRGTQKWRIAQDDGIAEDHEPDEDFEGGLQESRAENGLVDESVFEPLAISTPGPLRNHAIIEEGMEEEARLQAPPLSRLNTEALQDKAAEEVFDRISALQAEVERMRMEDENRRAAYQTLEREHEEMKEENENAREENRSRYHALREEHKQLQQTHTDTQDSLQKENTKLAQDYKNTMERIRALQNDPDVGRRTKAEPSCAEFENASHELARVKAEAEADNSAAQLKIRALEEDLRASRDESQSRQAQIESIQDANTLTIKDMNVELEAKRKEVTLERKESIDRANEVASLTERNGSQSREIHTLADEVKVIKMELEHAHEQLVETRRVVETVEDENDRLVQQIECQAQDILDLQAVIKTKDVNPEQPVPVTELAVDVAIHKAALETLSQQHQSTLSLLGAEHGKEIQTLRNALLKAGEGMQKREARLAKTHDDQIASLEQEIAALKQQQAQPWPTSESAIEKELRSAIRVLGTRLEKANASLASAQAEAEEARQQAEDAQHTNAIVNAELEARFAETVEAREKEWRRRVDLLFKERDKMGKALMWGWGREEVGAKAAKDREQGYRYKFVTRQ